MTTPPRSALLALAATDPATGALRGSVTEQGAAVFADVAVTGLPGATAGGRLAGATASGAPVSGTFQAGDLVVDRSGATWVCTAGGTPGTWTSGSGGTVTSVTAGDASVTAGGSGGNVTLETGTLDQIATLHPPAANWSNNSHKITGLASGSVATDAATFGQTAAGGAIVSGQFLCAPSQYAPAAQTLLGAASPTMSTLGVETTVAAGSSGGEISTIASWSAPSAGTLSVASTTGFATSGTILVAASGTTVATVTYTGTSSTTFTGCAYVSGSATGTVATGGTVVQSGASSLLSTGAFTAPPSGMVAVTTTFLARTTAGNARWAVGLAAHGTVTPILGNLWSWTDNVANLTRPYMIPVMVTGLTPGTSYNFDLLAATVAGDTLTMYALGQATTTPTLNTNGTDGAPVMMMVQAI